jgi:hypothetical protein
MERDNQHLQDYNDGFNLSLTIMPEKKRRSFNSFS